MSLFVRPCAVLSMHVLMGTFCYTGVRSQLVLFNAALLLQCELIKKKGKKKKGSFIWELQIAREVLQSRRMINEPLLCFSPRTASSGKGWKSGSKSCKIKNKKKKPFQLGSALCDSSELLGPRRHTAAHQNRRLRFFFQSGDYSELASHYQKKNLKKNESSVIIRGRCSAPNISERHITHRM